MGHQLAGAWLGCQVDGVDRALQRGRPAGSSAPAALASHSPPLLHPTPPTCRYEEGYEPYIIVSRAFVPWYDERFVGYRKNKVVHLLYLSSSGIQFVVHPRAFAVHAPHPRARTWKVTHKTGLWDQVGGAGRWMGGLAGGCALRGLVPSCSCSDAYHLTTMLWHAAAARLPTLLHALHCVVCCSSSDQPPTHTHSPHLRPTPLYCACSWPRSTTGRRRACSRAATSQRPCTRAAHTWQAPTWLARPPL